MVWHYGCDFFACHHKWLSDSPLPPAAIQLRPDGTLPRPPEPKDFPSKFLGPVRFALSCMRMGLFAAEVVGTGEVGCEGNESRRDDPARVRAHDGSSETSG